jgi:cytochrome c oxidase assembly protein subunit 15
MRSRLAVTPEQFRTLTYIALGALALIVATGAAVRLTASGLGCPTWPRCYGKVLPPIQTHALIEFGNRALSGFVGVITLVVAGLAFTRTPRRKDLIYLSLALPLGVAAQAVLGGFTVREKLAPGFVMSHFLLSMVILVIAVALAWRATHEPGSRPRSADRTVVRSVRGLVVLSALTVFAGTAATAAGPHSGGLVGQHIKRLTIEGPDTLQWAIHQHATVGAIFGVAVIGVWLLKRRRGGPIDPLEPLTILGLLLAAQGLVGSTQYELRLPAEMVWVHVVLATITWIVSLWAVAVEGRLVPRHAARPGRPGRPDPAAESPASAGERDAVGELGLVG